MVKKIFWISCVLFLSFVLISCTNEELMLYGSYSKISRLAEQGVVRFRYTYDCSLCAEKDFPRYLTDGKMDISVTIDRGTAVNVRNNANELGLSSLDFDSFGIYYLYLAIYTSNFSYPDDTIIDYYPDGMIKRMYSEAEVYEDGKPKKVHEEIKIISYDLGLSDDS